MTLTYLAAALLVLGGVLYVITLKQVEKLRSRGLYPESGTATIADVERLYRAGYRRLAIRCYREIHGGNIASARKAVHSMFSQQGA